MKNLSQYLNEALIMELSSELLGRASKAAREKGRNAQANRFAIAAGKALEKELKGWKPGPDAKNCGKVVATVKDMTANNPAMKALAKAEPASKVSTIKFPVLKQITSGSDNGAFKFVKWKDVKVPKAKFYIYKDEYHHCLHIGTLSDLLGLLGSAYFDYEDFDASYIVKSFDNIKDAVKYARNSGKKFYDSNEFMNDVIEGNIVDSDLYWDGPGDSIIDIMLGWTDILNLPDDWADVEDTSYE
nr:MAG TPA: hypothetical protein [Ackermannviridae sp.]